MSTPDHPAHHAAKPAGVPAAPAGQTRRQSHPADTGQGQSGQHEFIPTVEPEHFVAVPNIMSVDSLASASPRATSGLSVSEEIARRLAECGRDGPDGLPRVDGPAYPVPGRKFVLIEPIGHGTYGSVWKAHAAGNEARLVAIKFFPRARSKRAGMGRELENIRQLTNQHGFIQVLDVSDPAAEWPYFVMSYAPASLQGQLEASGPLPVRRAAQVFTKLVKAMAHAHSPDVGLCHCDLKPSNVLMTAKDGGDPLITDFGQSRMVDERGRAVLGSYFYMPPDQATLGREEVDKRWDVYALGAIAYQLVVPPPNNLPRRDKTWKSVESTLATKDLAVRLNKYQSAVAKAGPPTAHRRARGMDGQLAAIIDRCLDLDPDRRFRDAGEIRTALQTRDRTRRWKPIVAVGLAANLLCLGVITGLVYAGQRKTVAAQKENLTRQVLNGQQDTALVASKLLEDKIGRRVRFLENHARSAAPPGQPAVDGPLAGEFVAARDALVDARRKARERHDWDLLNRWLAADRRPVDRWLTGVARAAWGEGLFTEVVSVNVCADGACYNFARVLNEGSPAAPTPAVDNPWEDAANVAQFTKDFSYRDWYGRSGYGLTDQSKRADRPPPITAPNVSVLYRSTHGYWLLTVTAPIWADDPGTGHREVVGLLGGSINVEEDLTKWVTRVKAGADGPAADKIELIVINDRGFLVWHPDLDAKLRANDESGDPAQSVYTSCQTYGQSAGLFEAGVADGPRPDDPAAVDVSFLDPWDRDEAAADGTEQKRYLARRAAFYPLGQGDGQKPWYVIVKADRDTALAPVSEFEDDTWDMSLLTLGLFLGMSGLIWGGVFWALKRTEGDVDG